MTLGGLLSSEANRRAPLAVAPVCRGFLFGFAIPLLAFQLSPHPLPLRLFLAGSLGLRPSSCARSASACRLASSRSCRTSSLLSLITSVKRPFVSALTTWVRCAEIISCSKDERTLAGLDWVNCRLHWLAALQLPSNTAGLVAPSGLGIGHSVLVPFADRRGFDATAPSDAEPHWRFV
jgi:hypothetical protein